MRAFALRFSNLSALCAFIAGSLAVAGCHSNAAAPAAAVEESDTGGAINNNGVTTVKKDAGSVEPTPDAGPPYGACKATSECKATDDCTGNGSSVTACHTRTYPEGVGDQCYVGNPCKDGTECIGNPEDVHAVCSVTCGSDLDCPSTMACTQVYVKDGPQNYCTKREFCASCSTDEQCGAGNLCVDMGQGKFCSKACNAGSTECPRYADCNPVGDKGLSACMHRAGTCIGDGSLCAPCADNACNEGGTCLTFPSFESFCGASCKTATDCGAGYECDKVSQTGPMQCVPQKYTCVAPLKETMNVGDIMEDYSMIGYIDTNGDGKLGDEQPHLIRLSDFSNLDLIAFTVSTGWCVPCQQETTTFATTMKALDSRVMIFQVLVDGPDHTKYTVPTLKFSKFWVTQYHAAGASGIDVKKVSSTWNTSGSIPMNIVLDAKTRKILKKFNGSAPGGWTPVLGAMLKGK